MFSTEPKIIARIQAYCYMILLKNRIVSSIFFGILEENNFNVNVSNAPGNGGWERLRKYVSL